MYFDVCKKAFATITSQRNYLEAMRHIYVAGIRYGCLVFVTSSL